MQMLTLQVGPLQTIMAISALFLVQLSPKFYISAHKPVRMPIIAFWGLEMAQKGVYSIFVVAGDKFQILKFVFLVFFETKMTKIDILNPKLIVPYDYQQFLALFHISIEK